MNKGIKYTGYPSEEELAAAPGIPSLEDLNKKPLAVIECFHPIACNPCEQSCPFGAITIGDNICNLPVLNPKKCRGCGICMAHCPGLAIFLVDINYASDTALVKIPYELFPLPKEGEEVECLDRKGEAITRGKINSLKITPSYKETYIVAVEVPKKFAMTVRNIKL